MTGEPETAARFVSRDAHAEVAVIVVTYNNADHVASLLESLRSAASEVRLRLIVADNSSADSTVALLLAEPDVIVVETGGNLGYAGGVNAASSHLGEAGAVLVLNPDLTVEPGSIRALLNRMSSSSAGIIAPRLVDRAGASSPSLRREPTLLNSLGDAVFGRRMPQRSALLSETVFPAGNYDHAHPIEWSTGAALLIRRDVADRIGRWDERFFLYSEEVDYFRRVRESGETVWFEPLARMRHDEGGSGASRELRALMAVNRVRYIRKYHSPAYASAFHATVILHELVRAYSATHRFILGTLLKQSRWRALPSATRRPN